MDMVEFGKNQHRYKLMVCSSIRKRFPHCPQDTLDDCYQDAILLLLKRANDIPDDKIYEELVVYTYDIMGKYYKGVKEFTKYVVDGAPVPDTIRFKHFNPYFINSLTYAQKKIYLLRKKGLAPRQMHIGITSNCINVQSWTISKKYKEWMLRRKKEGITLEGISKLPQRIQRIMTLYYEGYQPKVIARMVDRPNVVISSIIFRGKHAISRHKNNH